MADMGRLTLQGNWISKEMKMEKMVDFGEVWNLQEMKFARKGKTKFARKGNCKKRNLQENRLTICK